MKKNIAILCITHTINNHFRLLVEQLSSDFDIYIHFDKKNELQYKQEIDSLSTPRIRFVKNENVYWGGYSQILSEYNLLKEAFESKKNYSHYVLISGADFPIKSNKEIQLFFEQNEGISFLEIFKLPHSSWGFGGGMDRVSRFWLTEFKNRNITKILGRITLLIQRALGVKRQLFFKEYYGGGNWADLAHNAVEYILNYINNNPKILHSFKQTRSGDEIWKQTILKTSKNIVITNNLLRYIDWRKGPQFPRILDETDYDEIMRSNSLFARKFKGQDLTLQNIIVEKLKNT
ncbi:beta-1,6-N-acetylglucosaminyltransferase [Capnocytophaga stomatis]|uniref:beta-1,6-N-acetylglucosaminyltransferase n=1 Tax=Capnocytophaga stomatis TaxID=1848904 RepID=UPI00385F8FF1